MDTLEERVVHFAATRYVLVVPEPAEHTRHMATASNYDVFHIAPGRYPTRLVNINGADWNPDPHAATPGHVVNIGPYYVQVTVDAVHVHQHVVDRLLTASKVKDTYPNQPATVTEYQYAYLVHDGAPGPFKGSTFHATH
jgi:hypothetical protein